MRPSTHSTPQTKPASVGEQVASALQYLAENARSPLEGTVFRNAQLLCQGICDQQMEGPAKCPDRDGPLLSGEMKSDLLPALQHLEAEAKRHDLQVMECVMMATISLWMIAEDLEMLRKVRLQDEKRRQH